MRRIAAVLALTALVLAGCGDDDGDDAATDEPTAEADEPAADAPEGNGSEDDGSEDDGSEDAPGEEGTCGFVTAEALTDAFGTPIETFSANEDGCQFSATEDETLAIVVVPIDIQIDPEQYAEESTSTCDEGTVVEVDAGDYAYACQAIGPSASVFEGDRLVNLSVLTTDDEQGVLDAFVAVLPEVTVNP